MKTLQIDQFEEEIEFWAYNDVVDAINKLLDWCQKARKFEKWKTEEIMAFQNFYGFSNWNQLRKDPTYRKIMNINRRYELKLEENLKAVYKALNFNHLCFINYNDKFYLGKNNKYLKQYYNAIMKEIERYESREYTWTLDHLINYCEIKMAWLKNINQSTCINYKRKASAKPKQLWKDEDEASTSNTSKCVKKLRIEHNSNSNSEFDDDNDDSFLLDSLTEDEVNELFNNSNE